MGESQLVPREDRGCPQGLTSLEGQGVHQAKESQEVTVSTAAEVDIHRLRETSEAPLT